MNVRSRALMAVLAAPLFLAFPAWAKVTLPAIIGDHMVVQAGKKVNIWGWADPGEAVTVTFAGQNQSTKAGSDGAWQVTLDPVKQSAESLQMTVKGDNTLRVKDILVGEVWLCSGQSNMEFPLKLADGGKQAVASATNQAIRLFHTPRNMASKPVDRVTASDPATYRLWDFTMEGGKGYWTVCNPKAAARFTAVGYFFGRELQEKLNRPVGLIESAWGGTPVEAWTSASAMAGEPAFAPLVEAERRKVAQYDPEAAKAKYDKALAAWEQKAAAARAAGKKAPSRPRKPLMPGHNRFTPAVLFNGMIHPLIPFTIQGAIWYQGANNSGTAFVYRTLLSTMIKDWRNRWGYEFPVGIVQLPNWRAVQTQPVEDLTFPVLRESQLRVAQHLPKVGLTVNIDVGDVKSIHPTDKLDVGHRLALWALAKVYGRDVVYSGPIYDSMKINGNKVRLIFKHVDGGLIAKGHDGKLVGFAAAGADKVFHFADASIDGDVVVVHSDAVPKPVAVRYAWATNPLCNLYNKSGLPASPFRTDDWHVATQGK